MDHSRESVDNEGFSMIHGRLAAASCRSRSENETWVILGEGAVLVDCPWVALRVHRDVDCLSGLRNAVPRALALPELVHVGVLADVPNDTVLPTDGDVFGPTLHLLEHPVGAESGAQRCCADVIVVLGLAAGRGRN